MGAEMSETKWTPGPWEVVRHGSIAEYLGPRVCRNGNISDDIKLCGNRWVEGAWKDDPEAHANMHLIAAAPDLYAALERMERHFRMLSPDMDAPGSVFAQAIAALSKARGEK